MGVTNGNTPANGHADIPSHFIGGNRLEVAPPSSVKDFVANNDGHSVITSVSSKPRSQRNASALTNSLCWVRS
jgi:hypothetical protein